jgi:hypothetical protein
LSSFVYAFTSLCWCVAIARFLKALNATILLQRPNIPVFGTVDKMISEISYLNFLVKSYSVWGINSRVSGPFDLGKYECVLATCDKLLAFFLAKPDAGESESSDSPKKGTLRLRVHKSESQGEAKGEAQGESKGEAQGTDPGGPLLSWDASAASPTRATAAVRSPVGRGPSKAAPSLDREAERLSADRAAPDRGGSFEDTDEEHATARGGSPRSGGPARRVQPARVHQDVARSLNLQARLQGFSPFRFEAKEPAGTLHPLPPGLGGAVS